MKIFRYKRGLKEKSGYGYFDPINGNIYIRNDLNKVGYIMVFFHEFIHFLIWKIIPLRMWKFVNCWFDMFDTLLTTWNLNDVRSSYKDYYETK